MRTKNLRQIAAPHSPRRIAQAAALLLACFVSPAQAALVDGEHLVIDVGDSTPDEIWNVTNGGSVHILPGVQATNFRLAEGSSMMADGMTVDAHTVAAAVAILNSSARISNSYIHNSLSMGLVLGGVGQNTTSPTAVVTDSTISGGQAGISVTTSGSLTLINTDVIATGTTEDNFGNPVAAVINHDSHVVVSGGSLTGGTGLWVSKAQTGDASNTVLNNTSVVGNTGAGILFQNVLGGAGRITSTLLIENGTTVTGANGNLIEANGNVEADVTVDNSQLTGNVVGDGEASLDLTLRNHASITGSLINVDSLAVNSNAQWKLTDNNSVPTITMDGGLIDIHGTAADGNWHTLDVESLSGNGAFAMQADLKLGEADRLNVDNATGNYELHVTNSGREGGVEQQLLVDQGSGDATFSLVGDKVDAGVYSYILKSTGEAGGEQEWHLERSDELTPGTDTVIGIHSAIPTVWLGEHSLLRTRLGEVRLSESKEGGVWARTFGSKFNANPRAGSGYSQDQWGVISGADFAVGNSAHGNWLVGGMVGTSTSRLKFDTGSKGSIESHTAGLYATWLGNSGVYFDGVLKYNRFGSELDVRMSDGTPSKGEFTSHGIGASAEVGRTIELQNRWFVEPFGQVAGMWASGSDFMLDNGMHARTGGTSSLLATAGVNVGKTFETSKGTFQPYAKFAVTHEFATGNSVTVNDIKLDNDISGTRFEVGAGLAAQMAKRLHVYLDASYSIGKRLDKPWGVNAGVRYSF